MLKFFLTILVTAAPFTALAANTPAASVAKTVVTNATTTNAPSATAPAPIAIGDVMTQAQTLETQLQQKRIGLNPDQTLQDAEAGLPQITQVIDDRITSDAPLLEGNGSLSALEGSQATWQSVLDDLSSSQKDLSARVKDLDDLLGMLSQESATWTLTQGVVAKANTPGEMLQRVQQMLALIDDTSRLVHIDQNQLYQMQSSIAQQDARARLALSRVNQALENARKRLLERNRPPLWSADALTSPGGGIVAQERTSLGAQVVAVHDYLTEKIGAVVAQLVLFLMLAIGFIWLRNEVRAQAEKKESLRGAARVFDIPLANALLLALVSGWWLYPNPPNLLWAGIGAVALAPAVIIIRRLIDPVLFPVLYATVFFFAFDEVRLVIRPGGVLSRFLLIFELLSVCLFLLATLRLRKAAAQRLVSTRFENMAQAYFHTAFFVFWVAGFANILGYILLSILLSSGMLQSSYYALLFYAGVRVFDALVLSALCLQPLSGLRMVRRNHDLIYQKMSTIIRWGACGLWVVLAIYCFSQLGPVYQGLGALLNKQHSWGSMNFRLGPIVAFPITVWAAFVLSRFIRFCLEEEVYPHFQLGRGIPYAASTVVHYSILIVGFLIALNVLGVNLSDYAVLTAAFGVGLGFGLQNILNNFMSGLILLFERPIKVGDMVQIDANTMGKVERIGIRASVILLTNGSELIMPNGNLISNPVTNWTLSNCERLIEIPVTVTSKVEPQKVIDLLTKTAATHPNVLKNPAPQAILVTLGASLAFRLRVWIDTEDEWMKITSEISLAVNDALAKENITLG